MSNKNEEWISKIAVASRLGESVETVEKLIKEKKLKTRKEQGKVMVSKESVYEYSGLSYSGHQTNIGEKPNIITYEEAKEILKVDNEILQGLIRSGVLEKGKIDGRAFGVSERSVKQCKERSEEAKTPKMRTAMAKPIPGAMPGVEESTNHLTNGTEVPAPDRANGTEVPAPEETFSHAEMIEVADISYKLGRLSVYENMSEFKRKETA